MRADIDATAAVPNRVGGFKPAPHHRRIARLPPRLAAVEMRWVGRSTPLWPTTRSRTASGSRRESTARLNEATESRIAPRPSVLRMARVWPPFFSASLAICATSRGPCGELQPVERRLGAGLGLHPADVADQFHQPAGLLDLDRLAHRADRDRGLGDRGAGALAAPFQSITSRSERPTQAAIRPAELAGLARGLHRRQPDPRRRRRARSSHRCRR